MPKFPILLLIISLTLNSCIQDTATDENTTNGDSISMQNKINQLELDISIKDSVINESLSFFNEIKANLEAIGIRKDEIRAISDNEEISSDDKKWILEEIQHINFLREDNANMVQRMRDQMDKNRVEIKELEIMIESLIKEIQWKDEQITLLQEQLDNFDREYSALFNAYQEQAIQIELITDEMNTVHYAYGTEEELKANGVIEKKNGFMGIGKKAFLRDDFNKKYFTKIDITKTNNLSIEGTGMRFITYHPKTSYEISEDGIRTKIKIIDASEFWKISKYLVLTVE
jgi:hypothetical protein